MGSADIDSVIKELETILADDCSYYSGKVFGSMSSYPVPEAKKIYAQFIEKNAGDRNIFSATGRIEQEIIKTLAKLFNGDPTKVDGNIISGGSEGNVIALWAARNYMRKLKKVSSRLNIIIPETAHTSIKKAADLLDIEQRIIPTNEYYQIDIEKIEEEIDVNTFAIVGVAGNTVYGAIDDINSLSQIAQDHTLWLHVDAAFGGFILPFLEQPYQFDFSCKGVHSLVADPHKMLGAPIPCGSVLFKENNLSAEIVHHLPYFSGNQTENRTIVGTKPGASIIALYYILEYKGKDWIKDRVKKTLENANYLRNSLRKRNFQIKGKSELNVIATKPPVEYINKWNALHSEKWRIGKFHDVWRFVVMPTISKKDIDKLLKELDENKEG